MGNFFCQRGFRKAFGMGEEAVKVPVVKGFPSWMVMEEAWRKRRGWEDFWAKERFLAKSP
jgi:hypothetical protein